MFKKLAIFIVAVAIGLFFAGVNTAEAGAKIKIGDDSEFDLGMRVQTQWFFTDKDLEGDALGNPDGRWEDYDDFKVRRARIRLKANVTKWVTAFLQSDVADGADHKIIDAWVSINAHPWAKLIMGENMAPAQRTNLTSSGGQMTIDRPGLANKNLTWGMNTRYTFNNTSDSNNAVIGAGSAENAVRDTGLTLFGSGTVAEEVHLKYYLGYADGLQNGSLGDDEERYTARVQLNLGDAEPGYFNLGTYLGKKQTLAIGAFYDTQDRAGTDLVATAITGSLQSFDYSEWGVDIFAEQPIGDGALTFDAAYTDLDLDGSNTQTAGDGYYVQVGYIFDNWQPWAMYEAWSSDMDSADALASNAVLGTTYGSDQGSIDTYRIGLTYFIKGHNANVKIGYERYNSDEDIIRNLSGTKDEDTVDTFLVGFYMTY